MDWSRKSPVNGKRQLLDLEKAYDVAPRSKMQDTMRRHGVGPWFRTDMKVKIACGIIKSFQVRRGCSQGRAVSSYRFLMLMEWVSMFLSAWCIHPDLYISFRWNNETDGRVAGKTSGKWKKKKKKVIAIKVIHKATTSNNLGNDFTKSRMIM